MSFNCHPLEHDWQLWYVNDKRGDSYENRYTKVYSFNNVENFWMMWNNIAMPDKLPTGCSYNLFKCGILPVWEDEQNKSGGEIRVFFNRQTVSNITDCFETIVLAAIGECLSDDICGVTCEIRGARSRISVWINKQTVHAVEHLKQNLISAIKGNGHDHYPLRWEVHSELLETV